MSSHHHAAEFFESMRDNPGHIGMIVHLLLLGDYGKRAQASARRALKLSKKAKLTKLTQLAGIYEFGSTNRAEVVHWNRLTAKQQDELDSAIEAELRHRQRSSKKSGG